jgi:hypothetical protein
MGRNPRWLKNGGPQEEEWLDLVLDAAFVLMLLAAGLMLRKFVCSSSAKLPRFLRSAWDDVTKGGRAAAKGRPAASPSATSGSGSVAASTSTLPANVLAHKDRIKVGALSPPHQGVGHIIWTLLLPLTWSR